MKSKRKSVVKEDSYILYIRINAYFSAVVLYVCGNKYNALWLTQ